MESKILLCCIFKDDSEYEMIERMLKSFMPHVHGLVAVLTGVSGEHNKLKKLLDDYQGRVVVTSPDTHPQIYAKDGDSYIFANFAEARNVSFEEASKMEGFDWWMWADADDVLLNGEELQIAAQRGKEMNLDSIFFTYWYAVSQNAKGEIEEVIIEHLRERLLKPNIFKWISRLHEVAVPKEPNYQPKNSLYDFNPQENRKTVWAHLAQRERMEANLQRNIKILHQQAEEEQGKDPRTLFYLAKTYYDLDDPATYPKIEELIGKYLEMSGWDEERSFACEYLGNLSCKRGDHRQAIERYYASVREYPNRHMPYLLLGKEYFELGLKEQSKFWLDVALKLPEPKTRTTIGNPLEIKSIAASLSYNHAIAEQNLDQAIYWLKIRNQLLQIQDDGLLKAIEDAKQLNEAAKWVFQFAKWLKDTGNEAKISHLLKSLPLELGREAFAHYIANEIGQPNVWEGDTIVIYASFGGEHFEQWSGKSLERGIGGSETAVIRLAEEWTKRGYKVTIFGDPREDEGIINGVEYRPWYEFNWKDEFNILILWRSPHLLDRDIKAKKLFMDLHDMSSALDYTPERIKKLDKVFFKSNYHRKQVPQLPEEKVAVISNGI